MMKPCKNGVKKIIKFVENTCIVVNIVGLRFLLKHDTSAGVFQCILQFFRLVIQLGA